VKHPFSKPAPPGLPFKEVVVCNVDDRIQMLPSLTDEQLLFVANHQGPQFQKSVREAAGRLRRKREAALKNGGGILNGIQLIAAERQRQIEDEKFTAARDDKYTDNELAKAAESYLVTVTSPDEEGDENGKTRPAWDWPWDKNWWKPSEDPIRNLVKAGALIAAEIDRLQRAEAKGGQS
jgi:hypothetical protein